MKNEEIFKSLQGFSPTGKPKRIPLTDLNIIKFEQFLISAKKYFDAGAEMGNEYDLEKIANLRHLSPNVTDHEEPSSKSKKHRRVTNATTLDP